MSAETTTSPPSAPDAGREPFSPALRKVIAVTTLGAFMVFLDSTVVNVALQTLTKEWDTSLSTIQWLVTAYLLAMTAVIPISGWFGARWGAKRVFIAAIAVFTLASLACALATSVEQLIAFRALQGIGGIAVPVSQAILVRAAGPRLMARVVSVSGIPVIMAPVIGPTLGGLLLQHVGWESIFLVNIPIGMITVLLAVRLLPGDTITHPGKLDVPGLVTIVAASVGLTFGLSEIGNSGHATSAKVLVPLVSGALLLASFIVVSLRRAKPLLDLRLFKDQTYSAASLTNFFMGALSLGAVILMPLYFQTVRGEDAVATGLLLIPQGVGIAVALLRVARFVDKFGSGPVALVGGLISIVGTVPFVLIGDTTSYWWIGVAMVVRGFGIGTCAVPAVTAAFRAVSPMKIPDATVQLNVGQRIGGSLAAAILAVVLQRQLQSAHLPADQANGFGVAFWWTLGIGAAAALPAVLLAVVERRTAAAAAPAAPAGSLKEARQA
ncbi:MDR family MFS transporter [Xylanimonas ulmi]|uniref:EmrB/QacA subfamily drug resistance transporter n=1 Tax=Xylanimonas ulmi TaxID=228973 RepID=A0A4Q7M2D7_9MICO|nr:MDR family MFS transporter [Xylanibacterium ulmi]RZS60762.1 EmrB/QacA subfamily drug resistance transporter [Xylanibacterium ulmi]